MEGHLPPFQHHFDFREQVDAMIDFSRLRLLGHSRHWWWLVLAGAGVMVAALITIMGLLNRLLSSRQKNNKNELIPEWKLLASSSLLLHHMARKSELQDLSGNIDIGIVGSGVGALVSGAILSKCGYKVAVFEQHSTTVGGSTHMYSPTGTGRRDCTDFEFDVGVHYVGGNMDQWTSVFRILFAVLTNGQLEWNRIADVYDVAYNATTGQRLEFTADHAYNRKTILMHFPNCPRKALDRYYTKCRRARSVAYIAFGLKCLPPFMTKFVWKYLGYGALYKKFCLGRTLDVMRQDCGLPDDVIGALTYSYGDYGTPPGESPFFMQAFMQCHYEGGAFFPKGGSASIAKTLVACILQRGGHVFAAAPVERILTQKNWRGKPTAMGVRVKGVDVLTKRAVLSDAGFSKTFEVDCSGNLPLVDQVAGTSQLELVHKKEVQPPLRPSTAFFYLFVGLDGTDEELHLPGQNIWHCKNWNHDQVMQEMMQMTSVQEALEQEPPLVFLSNESAKDPDYAQRHPGKSAVTIISFTNPKWFEAWKDQPHDHRGAEYEEIKSKVSEQLLNILYLHFPLTKGRVAYQELGTPLSTNKYLGRSSGEIYNLDHNVERFASLDAQLGLHPETTVQNLFLTGQDTVAVSVEGATLGGLFASARVSNLAFVLFCIPATVALLPWAIGFFH